MEQAVSEEYKKDLREQMLSFTRKKEEEFKTKLEDFARQSNSSRLFLSKDYLKRRNGYRKTWKRAFVNLSAMILKTNCGCWNSQTAKTKIN